ncbi:MAG: Tim44/TimA family putative adaptor protein [Geminicoccaceae bacterium]
MATRRRCGRCSPTTSMPASPRPSTRARRQAAASTEIVSIRSAEIAAAGMSGPYAKLTIRYLTEQINVTRDAGDNVVDGDPTRIAEVVDIWTFTRDTRTSDPNWQLTETRTPD